MMKCSKFLVVLLRLPALVLLYGKLLLLLAAIFFSIFTIKCDGQMFSRLVVTCSFINRDPIHVYPFSGYLFNIMNLGTPVQRYDNDLSS